MRKNLIFKAILLSMLPVLLYAAKAPDFTVTDYNNKVHKLYDDYLNKDKVFVIKFFFVGCPPCATVGPIYQQAYTRWGAGTGRVQFIEISILNGDNNALVKSYHQTKGFTFPGVGVDGGAQAAIAPYKSGTFGPWFGTPTFAVIAPNGEVSYNIPVSKNDASQLDTAIAQALRVNQGGGGGCSNAFSVKTITQKQPETYYVMDLLNGNPANELKTGIYNCEFALPPNIDGHYVIPQINAIADPLNGLTTTDIVLIQRFILGLVPFNNLQRAVADVNNSNTVSVADISEIRKLILGVTNKFSKLNKSYAIVHNPKSKNPLDLTDRVLVKDILSNTKSNEFGVGQYGDVSGSNLLVNDKPVVRSSAILNFLVETNKLTDGNYEHRFYTNEDHKLTAFQLEMLGKPDNIIGVTQSIKLSSAGGLDFNFNVSPGVLRMLGIREKEDIHFEVGETWFTIYTKSMDQLKPSYLKNFTHEFLFEDSKEMIRKFEIQYLKSMAGEFVTITQKDYNDVVISSKINFKSMRVLNSNGHYLRNEVYPILTNHAEINTSNFLPGIYFAQVQLVNGSVETKKFIKF